MPDIKLKARIQNKYDSLDKWNELSKGDYVPLKGEVSYATEDGLLYQKIGDGITDFVDLPWLLNQADNNINDLNSPSYIKNRLGYIETETIAETDQLLANSTFTGLDILENGNPIISTAVLADLYNYNQRKIFPNTDYITICASENYQAPNTLYYQHNCLSYTIANNTSNFVIDYNNNTRIQSNLDWGHKAYCVGNTNWGNLFMAYLKGLSNEYTYFTPNLNNNDKYCLLTIESISSTDQTTVINYLILDSDFFAPIGENSNYYYNSEIKFLSKEIVKTINDKFIENNNSNIYQNLPNNYSIPHETYSLMESTSYENSYYESSITLTIDRGYSSDNLRIYKVSNESVSQQLEIDSSFFMIETCDINLGGIVYENCPVFQRKYLYTTVKDNIYFIGNPFLLSCYTNAMLGTAAIYSEEIQGISNIIEKNNNIPFVFGFAPEEGQGLLNQICITTLALPSEYTTRISIIPSQIKLGFNSINASLLPEEVKYGVRNLEKESLILNNGYEASGYYSLSTGLRTRAQGDNSLSLGENTNATGINSIASGKETVAKGNQSLSGGAFTEVAGENSLGLGSKTIVNTKNSLAIGQEIIIIDSATISPISAHQFTFTNTKDISRCNYCQLYTLGANKESKNIKFEIVSISDNIYTINLIDFDENCNSYTHVRILRVTETGGTDAVANTATTLALGQGAIAQNQSYVLGCGNESSETHQTVIGKYNNPTSGAFIIGNGENLNDTANAFVVDWDGNLEISGNLTFNDAHSDYDITKTYIELNSILTNTIDMTLKYSGMTGSQNFENEHIEIHNKNWWPIQGWPVENETDYTTANGSIIRFNSDGSIYINYVAGDTFNISQKLTCSQGYYILSNGINQNLGVNLSFASVSTSDGNYPGISPIIDLTTTGAKTLQIQANDSTATAFETTIYPQLEKVNSVNDLNTSYAIPKLEIKNFDNLGQIQINTLNYSSWENPVLFYPKNSLYSVKSYKFSNKLHCFSESQNIITYANKDKKYIVDLKNLGNLGQFIANIESNNLFLKLNITLGYKQKSSGAWKSYVPLITPEQLAIVDLFDIQMMNSLIQDEYMEGYRMPAGYLINTKDNWSLGTEDLKNILTNKYACRYTNGDIRLNKIIDSDSQIEYCNLIYYLSIKTIDETTTEFLTLLSQVDKLICYLPEGSQNIFVN